jgi:branched-chain amino acid transport system substrate-binding protein
MSAEKVVKIGASIALSGKFVREGTAIKKGYEFWADWANSKGGITIGPDKYKVQMIYYDDESNPQTCAKLVEKLITEDKVDLLLGPYASGIAMPASTISERNGYVMMLPLNTADSLYTRGYKYIFGVAPLASHEGWSMLDMMQQQLKPAPKTIAILAPNSAFSLVVANGLKDHAVELGMDVVVFEKFPEETSDLSSLLSVVKIKDPDVIYVAGYFEHSTLITRQLKDLGYTPKAIAFSIGPQLPEFTSTLGKDAECALAPYYWGVNVKYADPAFSAAQYSEMFKEKFGHIPSYQSAYATAAGRLLQRAVEKAGSLDQDKIRKALSEMDLNDTITGPVKFDERGTNEAGKFGVIQIQNGEQKVIYPEVNAESKLVYPAVPWGKR